MRLQPYLPSAKFAVMVGALALSGGLVVAAQYATRTQGGTAKLAGSDEANQAAQAANWQEALREVEAKLWTDLLAQARWRSPLR